MGKRDMATGDIVAGDGGNHGSNGGFSDERDFTQAVVCHWNWNCRRFPGIGGPFPSAFSNHEHARNWAQMRREAWVRAGWKTNPPHLSNATWMERQAYREPKKDEWLGVVYKIDLSVLPPARRPALFESTQLLGTLDVDHSERHEYKYANNEFLILHCIPDTSIVGTYTSLDAFKDATVTVQPFRGPYYTGFCDSESGGDDKPPPAIVCSHT